jgi:antirestriction protein ArdC
MSKDAYQAVTDRIIDALERGFIPWRQPWKKGVGDDGMPRSLSSGKRYNGINVWLLAIAQMAGGYESNYWLTYNQAKKLGGNVRRGEKGTKIILWKPVRAAKPKDGEDKREGYLLMREFTVFNVDQCDGISAPSVETESRECNRIEAADAVVTRYLAHDGPTLSHGGDRAFYAPAIDAVRMPMQEAFDSDDHYYSTLFHELAHSTGHSDRLARPSLVDPQPFGSPDYSREELVAEMAAAFLCGETGIDVNVEHHAGYVQNWLQALQGDRKLVVQAAAAAQKAVDLIVNRKKEEAAPQPHRPNQSRRNRVTHQPRHRRASVSHADDPRRRAREGRRRPAGCSRRSRLRADRRHEGRQRPVSGLALLQERWSRRLDARAVQHREGTASRTAPLARGALTRASSQPKEEHMQDYKADDFVWCVQVRKVDPPQFVAEIDDNLDDHVGGLVGFEQCDNCGNVAYEIVKDGKQYYAVCTEDPDDEISRQFGGCGTRYRVRLEKARQVAF